MSRTYFADCDKVAKEASARITTFLELRGKKVMNVEGDKFFQQKDIDLVVITEDLEFLTVEVKGEVMGDRTGNYFLEIISNNNKGTPGCIYQTRAQYLFFLFMDSNELCIFETEPLQQWLREHEDKLPKGKGQTTSRNGEPWYHSVGCLVPRQRLNAELQPEIHYLNDYLN